ncbi:GerAB/ArcD/ProY family transporter [Sutcliffiella halmapala]
MDKSFSVVCTYILTHLSLIFFMYSDDIISSTDQGHWLPILLGVSVHIFIISIYMSGLKEFHNQDIVDIYTKGGKWMVMLFLVPVSLYFLAAIILSVRAYSEIINIVFLSNTPLWAVMAVLLFISSYLASRGLEAIFRTGLLLTFLFIPLIFFIFLVSFQNVDWHYLFPIWPTSFKFLTTNSYLKSFFAIGGGFLFLGFVQPYFSYKRKIVLIAAFLLVPCFLISVYIPILTFGDATASNFLFPFVTSVDSINLNWLMFDRITMFFLMSLITFIMLFISLVLWKLLRILHRGIPSAKHTYLTVIVSIFIYIVCLFIPNWNDVSRLFLWNTFLRFYVMFSVPISIYLLGLKARKAGAGKKGEVKHA